MNDTANRVSASVEGSVYESGEYLAKHPDWHTEDSYWKAEQIADILKRNSLKPASIAEAGCGAGGILRRLSELFPESHLVGWDISPQAISLASANATDRITFVHTDSFADHKKFDVLIVADVLEHVDNYIGFLQQLMIKGSYFAFHIPLDLSVSTILRKGLLDRVRANLGHLHYFTKESALSTLVYCGYEIVDWRFTRSSIDRQTGSIILRQVRRAMAAISEEWTVRVWGGFSLLVLARGRLNSGLRGNTAHDMRAVSPEDLLQADSTKVLNLSKQRSS